jgi:putative sugar O-methyltransferase
MIYDWDIPENNAVNYLKVCKSFVEDNLLFKDFRRNELYHEILEHVSYDDAKSYIEEMKNISHLTGDDIFDLKKNDEVGNPVTFEFEKFGDISPTTIRYIKNVLDISDFLDGEKVDNIVEIGGGYGGLCRIIHSYIGFENYMILDLPEVNELSKKYLSNFQSLDEKVMQMFYDEISSVDNIDLLISNYAFSECSFELQEAYYNGVISNANKFYITYNNITPRNMSSEYFLEYASKDFDIEVENEVRKCHTNFIMYGTKKNK